MFRWRYIGAPGWFRIPLAFVGFRRLSPERPPCGGRSIFKAMAFAARRQPTSANKHFFYGTTFGAEESMADHSARFIW